jgi:hypothetical protein
MIRELDTVVLMRDLEGYDLTRGDVGAVVHCYKDGVTFEVEFVTGEGATIAVVTLSQQDTSKTFAPCTLRKSCMSEP